MLNDSRLSVISRSGVWGKALSTIARVLGALDFGGAEVRSLELVEPLLRNGFRVHFVCLSGREGSLAEEARRLGAEVHPLPLNSRFPVKFVKLLRSIEADVVHSDVATFSGVIVALGRLAGVRGRIAHFRSDGDGHKSTPRRRAQRALMRRLINRHATNVVGVSPGSIEHGYSKYWQDDGRCEVLPNGVDVARLGLSSSRDFREEFDIASSEALLVHVGRPAPEKRRWLVPAMVGRLQEMGITAHIVFVGPRDDEDEARILEAALEAGVTQKVHFTGAIRQVGAILVQADVLVLPSCREGLPGVVLESLAVGTPVVCSDLPGMRFIAEHLSAARLVPQTAPTAKWASAIEAQIESFGSSDQRSRTANSFSGSIFTLDSSISDLTRLYRSVIRDS